MVNNIDSREFWIDLRKRVNSYFKENKIKKTANFYYYLKGIIMGLILWLPMLALVLFDLNNGVYILMWAIMGVGMAGVGMNVMHDANHESVSKKKKVNQFLGASMYLLSGNVFNWKVQHNVLHHTYTNLHGMDSDLDSGGILRFHKDDPYKKRYKYQAYYAPFLYGLMTINWVTVKDFSQLSYFTEKGMTAQMKSSYTKELVVLILSKILYYSVFIGIPLLAGNSIGFTILGFFIMHFIAGFILSMIFQLAHIVNEVDQLPNDPEYNAAKDFAIHQLSTTANFATRNKFLTFFSGGLNHQVEHHLFPGICHVHYPKIAKIVKETAKEYGVKYNEYDTFKDALYAHMSYLKELGSPNASMA